MISERSYTLQTFLPFLHTNKLTLQPFNVIIHFYFQLFQMLRISLDNGENRQELLSHSFNFLVNWKRMFLYTLVWFVSSYILRFDHSFLANIHRRPTTFITIKSYCQITINTLLLFLFTLQIIAAPFVFSTWFSLSNTVTAYAVFIRFFLSMSPPSIIVAVTMRPEFPWSCRFCRVENAWI